MRKVIVEIEDMKWSLEYVVLRTTRDVRATYGQPAEGGDIELMLTKAVDVETKKELAWRAFVEFYDLPAADQKAIYVTAQIAVRDDKDEYIGIDVNN